MKKKGGVGEELETLLHWWEELEDTATLAERRVA